MTLSHCVVVRISDWADVCSGGRLTSAEGSLAFFCLSFSIMTAASAAAFFVPRVLVGSSQQRPCQLPHVPGFLAGWQVFVKSLLLVSGCGWLALGCVLVSVCSELSIYLVSKKDLIGGLLIVHRQAF